MSESLPRIEAPAGMDRDDEQLEEFARSALEEMREHLEENRSEAEAFTDVSKTLEEVLATNNTRSLEIRARPLENPRVTLWLKDCPVWANDAYTDTFYPADINDYNGKVTATFDIRPF